MQEALGESLVWRTIATATRGQGKKKRKKVSKQFGKKTEITNEKVKMDAQLKERNACRKVGREYVKEEWSDKGVYFEDARV